MIALRVLLVLLATAIGASSFASERFRIGELRDQHHLDGAGCALQLLMSSRDVFQWDFEDEAWINLGGRDIRLHLESTGGANIEDGEGSTGDKEIVRFSGPDIRVTVTTTITSECAADDESCEAWTVAAVISVKTPRRSCSVRTKGLCGS